MMHIYLVRHGESAANLDVTLYQTLADHAVPLSERGHVQALAAGRFLRGHLLALFEGAPPPRLRMWTSPYRRTRQTADGVQAGLGDLLTDRREHINLCEQQFGLFDGVPDEALPERYPAEHAHYEKCQAHEGRFWARMPLGESRFDVAVRVHQAFGSFQRDADKHGIEHLVIICHGVTLRAFVMQWMHHTPEWFDAERNPGNCWVRQLVGSEDRGYIYSGEAVAESPVRGPR